jgi:hypothetical protein
MMRLLRLEVERLLRLRGFRPGLCSEGGSAKEVLAQQVCHRGPKQTVTGASEKVSAGALYVQRMLHFPVYLI